MSLGVALFAAWIYALAANIDGNDGAAWLAFLGRFHFVALHFPIGWLLLVPMLDYIAARRDSDGIRWIAGIVLLVAAASSVVTVLLGISLASADGYAGVIVERHMWLGVATATLATGAYVVREFGIPGPAYPVLIATAFVTIVIGGHYGGVLTQGEGYLTAKLGFDREPPLTLDSNVYDGVIQPILSARCRACHNDSKYKGRYNMSSHESLLAGGKSGRSAVVPGEPDASELYRRVTLPRHEKDAMPPAEEGSLDQASIELIAWWIEIGAPNERSINELSTEEFPRHVAATIDALIDGAEAEAEKPVYDPALIAALVVQLRDLHGLDVYAVSQNPADGLRVESVNRDAPVDAESLRALDAIAPYVRALDMTRADFGESELAVLRSFPHLEQLSLDHATISVRDLEHLAELRLKSLNLFSTALGAEAVDHLLALRTLRTLYVGETGIEGEALERLRRRLPRCEVL